MDFDFTKEPGQKLLDRNLNTAGEPLVSILSCFMTGSRPICLKRGYKMPEFYSCRPMADFNLILEGRVDADRGISVCCEKHIPMLPATGLADTAEETLERFLGMRVLTEAEFRDHPEQLSHGCGQCVYFRRVAWNQKAKISYVNLSMYPAPCQSKCVYCSEAEHLNRRLTPEVRAAYEKLFDFLEYAKKRGIIDPKAVWQVSSGEITLHRYKERIM